MIHTLSSLFTQRAATAVASVQALISAGPDSGAVQTPARKDGGGDQGSACRGENKGWDLVADEMAVRAGGGEILHLFGEVFDVGGAPIAGALVEIWQCDLTGRYAQTTDDPVRPRADPFRGFGSVTTEADGSYRFRTILPIAYPGRTPHIHARIVRPDGRELVTEIYLLDAPGNARDWVYQSLGKIGQAASSIDPVVGADGDLQAGFNFVV